ncbi:DUF6745 domain-containing protein [Actinomadura rupiterrae]|uniref:DUF6745 domain-containing protein n=1 Tax=Actinomadura rupiterrae TaxID=559627 RepID=UPI0020A4FB1A|nr:hypothetical protein [Actinomadura rupiterrae]MCP2335684.1 hypothetical protein [Actinomadura rupiterrae]
MNELDHANLMLSWESAAFATGPGDRARAEAGITAAYEAAGLDAPQRFLWVESPAQGALAAAVLAGNAEVLREAGIEVPDVPSDAGASVRDAVRTRPWEAARAEAHERLGNREWARSWSRTAAPLWDKVQQVVVRIRQAVGDLAREDGSRAESVLRTATLDAVLGQHDAPWLAQFDALGTPPPGLAEAARNAGWWWPYERLVIVSERPSELHRDEPGRLHRGDGPALAFPDGLALHAWRGMPIPDGFIASLTRLNAELRRVMLEVYGYDRYLEETGAKPLHRDETGVLWRIDLRDDEPVVMVEVVNSTPEPDGTYRQYYLRVPPETRTAREGVAWTFGIDAADYNPLKQT